ncbi:MAG: hypothetical protein ACIAXF_04405 [Phycisphaerales bacterium JB063]
MKSLMTGVAAAVLVAGSASAGVADYTVGFDGVSNNNAANTAAGESQFRLVVSASGADVLFTFYNDGPADSVMSELYWDDDAGLLDSMLSIDDSDAGVSYESVGSSVNPANMPAGNTIAFTADFATEPNNPQPHNGVGVGESVGVLFSHSGAFQDIVNAIESGELRIGLHAQSFANGGSESFVTSTGVPSPSAAALGLLMIAGLGNRRRRQH